MTGKSACRTFVAIGLGASLLVLTACGRNQNAAAHPASVRSKQIHYTPEQMISTSRAVEPNLSYSVDSKLNDQQLMDKIIEPAFKNQLSSDSMIDPHEAYTSDSRRALYRVNRAMLLLIQRSSPLLTSQHILAQYKQKLMAGCDLELRHCLDFGFFRQDYQSSKVAEALIKHSSHLQNYYNLVLMAWALKNYTNDPELTQLFLARLNELHLGTVKPRNNDWRMNIERMLAVLIPSMPTPVCANGAPQWLVDLHPWSVSRLKPSWLGMAAFHLLQFAAKCDQENPDKNHLLSNFLDKQKINANSFAFKQSHFFMKHPNTVKGLHLTRVSATTPDFYLVDRVFNGDLSPAEAIEVLHDLNVKGKTLFQTAQSYVRNRMALLIEISGAHMRPYFSDPKHLTGKMLADAINQSQPIAEKWQVFLQECHVLSDFLDLALDGNSSSEVNLKSQSDAFFNAIPRNIKYEVVYPETMMMVYYMAKRNYNHTFSFFGYRLTLNSQTVAKMLFNGEIDPLFNYTGNPYENALNPYQLLYALHFALATGTFKTFNVKPSDFFKLLMQQSTADLVAQLNKALFRLKSAYQSGLDWPHLMDICHALRHHQPYQNKFGLFGIENSPSLGSVWKRLNHDADSYSESTTYHNHGSYTTHKRGYFLYGSDLTEELDWIRVTLAPKLQYFKWMLAIYRDSLNTEGLSQKQIQEQLQAPVKLVNSIQAAIQDYVGTFLKRNREMNRCYLTLYRQDRKIENAVIADEIQYLRHIYHDMQTLQLHPELEPQLNARYALPYLPPGVQLRNHFDAHNFTYHQTDFLLRVRSYITTGYTAGSLRLPPIDPSIQISVPNNLTETDTYNSDVFSTIPYTKSESHFIAMGLQSFIPSDFTNNDMVFWNEGFNSSALKWDIWLNGLVDLYRLGPQYAERPGDAVTAQQIVEVSRKIASMFKLSPFEQKWMTAAGLSSFYSHDSPDGAMLYDNDKRPTGIMQKIFTWSYTPWLGIYRVLLPNSKEVRPQSLVPTDTQATQYAQTASSQAAFFYPLPSDLNPSIYQYFQGKLNGQIRYVEALENAIRQQEAKDQTTGGLKPMVVDLTKAPFMPFYVKPNEFDIYTAHVIQLNQDTGGFFKLMP